MIAKIQSTSKEKIRVEVDAVGISTAVLVSFTVEFAFSLQGIAPSAWAVGHWSNPPNENIAEVQVGTGSDSSIVLNAGNFYDVYLRVTETGPTPDLPVLFAGTLKVV